MTNSRTIRTYSTDVNQVEKRREEILDAAIRLFVQKGYHLTTTRELTGACGMSVGGLYYYVGSKEDILHMIATRMLELVDETTRSLGSELAGTPPPEALSRAMRGYFELVDRNRHYWMFANTESKVFGQDNLALLYQAHRQNVQFFEDLLQRGIKTGEFRVCNPSLLAHDITVLFPTWVTRHWYLKSTFKTVVEYSSQQAGLILSAITAHLSPVAGAKITETVTPSEVPNE